MVGRDKKDPSRRLTVALLLLVILHARRATAAPGPVRLEIAEPVGRSALEQGVSTAVRDATAKLEDAGCRQVFSDFRDASGRTIQENLEASGQTAQSYLTG
ncbi:MAG TPA: hypothetical protein VLO07_01060, partial [Thermoanaerobaculia bacterium]|nr:hypothetical protein [Thermoanaerobaculia bacterium]